MLYRTNVALGINGDRVEKGTEIELSREEAAQYHPDDLSPVSGQVQEPEPEPDNTPIEDMSRTQLQAKAGELGLSKAGSNADLIDRINLHLESQNAPEQDETQDEDDNANLPPQTPAQE